MNASVSLRSSPEERDDAFPFDVRKITSAPLRIRLEFRLDAPPEEAFETFSSGLPGWFSAIHSVSWDHSRSQAPNGFGVCSERSCAMGRKSVVERIEYWNQPHGYAYSVDGARSTMKFPLHGHCATFWIRPMGSGSHVVWSTYFHKKFHPMSPMVVWMMRDMMMKRALRKLFSDRGGAWL